MPAAGPRRLEAVVAVVTDRDVVGRRIVGLGVRAPALRQSRCPSGQAKRAECAGLQEATSIESWCRHGSVPCLLVEFDEDSIGGAAAERAPARFTWLPGRAGDEAGQRAIKRRLVKNRKL